MHIRPYSQFLSRRNIQCGLQLGFIFIAIIYKLYTIIKYHGNLITIVIASLSIKHIQQLINHKKVCGRFTSFHVVSRRRFTSSLTKEWRLLLPELFRLCGVESPLGR